MGCFVPPLRLTGKRTTCAFHQWPLGAGAWCARFLLTCAMLLTSSHSKANRGLYCESGMFFIEGKTYDGSVYLRSIATGPSPVPVTLSLLEFSAEPARAPAAAAVSRSSPNGRSATVSVPPGTNWTRFNFSLTATFNSSCPASGLPRPHDPENVGKIITCTGGLSIAISAADVATVDVDMVTLMPGAWGLLDDGHGEGRSLPTRAETAMALKEEGLGVIRMGGSMTAAAGYTWKQFAGRLVK